jgi:transposase-like protein
MVRQAIDESTKQKITDMVKGGASYSATAKEFNLNPPQVRKICIDAGIKSQHKSLRNNEKTESKSKGVDTKETRDSEEQAAESDD